jgi:hypothetical protein
MDTETEVIAQDQEPQSSPDMLATVILIIVAVFSPLVGLATGAALRLTGSEEVKKTGTTCMMIGGILWAMQVLSFLFIMMIYLVIAIIAIVAATAGH